MNMRTNRRHWMTFTLGLALATAAGTRLAAAEGTKPLALGAQAPQADTKLKSATDGKEVSIASVTKATGKKGTLVVFTCNDCPFARAWEERITALGNEYGGKGVGVLLVNSNNPTVSPGETFEATKEHAQKSGMHFAYAVDPQSILAKAFGAAKTPEAFLFDKGGKLVYHGTIDDNHEDAAAVKKHYLKDALDAVVGGQTPALQETKSMGCGIKFSKVS